MTPFEQYVFSMLENGNLPEDITKKLANTIARYQKEQEAEKARAAEKTNYELMFKRAIDHKLTSSDISTLIANYLNARYPGNEKRVATILSNSELTDFFEFLMNSRYDSIINDNYGSCITPDEAAIKSFLKNL